MTVTGRAKTPIKLNWYALHDIVACMLPNMTQDRQSSSGPANYHRWEKSFSQSKTLHKLEEFKFWTSRNWNFDKAFTMTIKVKVTKLGIVWFLSPGTISLLKIGEKNCSDSARHCYQKSCDWKATKSPKIRFVVSSRPKIGYCQNILNRIPSIDVELFEKYSCQVSSRSNSNSKWRSCRLFSKSIPEQEDDYDQRYGTNSWSNKRDTQPPFLKKHGFW